MKRIRQEDLTDDQREQLRRLVTDDDVIEKELAELRSLFSVGMIIRTNHQQNVQQVVGVERHRKRAGEGAYLVCRTAKGKLVRRNLKSARLVSIVET